MNKYNNESENDENDADNNDDEYQDDDDDLADLVIKKSFREISNDNLTKKFDTFECFNFRLDREALFGNNTNL